MARAGPKKVHRYSLEFKVKALDIHPFMLSRWRKEARDGVLRGSAPTLPVKVPPA